MVPLPLWPGSWSPRAFPWQRFPDVPNDPCPFLPQQCAALSGGRMRGRLQDPWKVNEPSSSVPLGGSSRSEMSSMQLRLPPGAPATAPPPHRGPDGRSPHLLVLGEPPHDGRVHDAVQEHGQGVNGEAFVTLILVYHHQDLLVGRGHGFDGVLQRANCGLLKIRSPKRKDHSRSL